MTAKEIDIITNQVIQKIREDYFVLPRVKSGTVRFQQEAVNLIINFVAEKHKMTEMEITQPNGSHVFAYPRHIACYLIKQIFGRNVPYHVIGERVGGRDHTTVIYGVKVIKDVMEVNKKEKARIDEYESEFRERYSDFLATLS